MADNRVILKKSSVASKVPSTSDLEYGELAVNYADGLIYFKDSSNNIRFFEETNSFQNVDVSGQTTLTADGGSDTLTFVEGSGIAITTDGSTNELTITATGSAGNDFVDSASFDTTNGELTLTRTDAGTVVVDLDGRFLLQGAKAADADLLDGENGTYYLDYDNFTNTPTLYNSSDFDTDFSTKSTSDLSEGSNLYYTDSRTRNALSASGDLSYDSATGTFSYTERSDSDIRGLFSASGDLTYDSATGNFSVTVPAGYDSSDFDTDFSNKDTDELSEGASNLYYTDTRVRNALSSSGDLSYDSATGEFSFTERTDSQVRGLFSSSGDLSYNTSTGEFSVTTYKSSDFDSDFSGKSTTDLSEGSNLYYTDTRVDSHLSGGTGVSYSSGTISIGQSVGITDNVEFNDVVVAGDLTVSGTTTTVNTETLDIADNNITLNSNYSGSSPTENGGITVNRGTQSDVVLQWNESSDHWEIESGGTTGRILTTGDEGSGNGLDADLLDGEQGSYYLNYNNFTNTPTIGDGTLTVSGGSGLSGSGTFDANATSNNSITIDHADTSSQDSVDNSNGSVIQDVTLDDFGHVTDLNSVDLDSRYLQSYTETDTLDSVTDRGNSTTNSIDIGSLDIGAPGASSESINIDANSPAYIKFWETGSFGMSFGYDGSGSGADNKLEIRNDGDTTEFEFYNDGRLVASSFSGDGSNLTSVDAATLSGQTSAYHLDYNNFTNTPTIGDGTLTVSGGAGLTGSGTFDANQTTNNTISIDHADTSTVSDLSASTNTFVDALNFDTYGHVTGYSTSTAASANDSTVTINAGDGLSTGGSFTTNQDTSSTITIDHADTSSVSNLSPSSRVYVTGLSFDTYGHVTGVDTQDEAAEDVSTLQFFLADGSRNDISLTAANELPFTLSDGSQNNIPLSA